MIVLYLIALIFILLLFIVNRKDFFSNQCNYVPWGPSYDFCVENCKSKNRIGLWDLTGNFCNDDVCHEKCIKCNNERCEWLSMWDRKKLDKELNPEPINPFNNNLVPKKINIKGVLWEEKFKIFWNSVLGIDKFMIHIFDLSNPNDKVKIVKIDNNDIIKDGNENSYQITGLKENRSYSITMYALNKYGISPPSNTINIKI